jgi:hypothetical protein
MMAEETSDPFWLIIAASYTEDELRYLDSLAWGMTAGAFAAARRRMLDTPAQALKRDAA